MKQNNNKNKIIKNKITGDSHENGNKKSNKRII